MLYPNSIWSQSQIYTLLCLVRIFSVALPCHTEGEWISNRAGQHFSSSKNHTPPACRRLMLVSDACRSPLCGYAAWSSLAVSELQLSAAMLLWLYHRAALLPSWIEFNCLRSAAVGKAARLLIYWQAAACRLVIPLRQVALAQLYKYHHQSGNAASSKLVWKQH